MISFLIDLSNRNAPSGGIEPKKITLAISLDQEND
jgi:hypothetical protein